MKKEGSKLEIEEKVKKSLNYSIIDASFYSSMVGFGEAFFSAFAVFLKANNIQLGLLGSLPQTIGSLSQLYSNKLLNFFKSRKKIVCLGALLQALMYIPIALVFFFGEFRVYHMIFFVSLYWIFGAVLGPAWNSWMGDLVKENQRGAYFGNRNRISGMVSFVSFLVAGFIIQNFSDGAFWQYVGFAIVFGVAFLSRLGSVIFLSKKYEPRYKIVKKAQFGFMDFIKHARYQNFGLFVIYLCFMNFAVFLAAPFFTAYMLYDLNFSYWTFTLITAVSIIVKFLVMPLWGKLSDRYGTRKILAISGFLMPLVPMLWVFSSNFWYLVCAQIYSGIVWAGFELSSFNFIFDSTSSQKRATCVAYNNVLVGVAVFVGGLLGGFIVRYNQVFWSSYILVFAISSLFRFFASVLFIPKIKEVRTVESISYRNIIMKTFTIMPTRGLVHAIITKHHPFHKKK